MRAEARTHAARRWHVLSSMRKLSSWATRIALAVGATSGVVAACYNDVPGPSGPLPPTREVSPQGPKPGPITPAPVIAIDGGVEPSGSRVIQTNTRIASGTEQPVQNPTPPTTPTPELRDAGESDVIDLPPVPDALELPDAPGVNNK